MAASVVVVAADLAAAAVEVMAVVAAVGEEAAIAAVVAAAVADINKLSIAKKTQALIACVLNFFWEVGSTRTLRLACAE